MKRIRFVIGFMRAYWEERMNPPSRAKFKRIERRITMLAKERDRHA